MPGSLVFGAAASDRAVHSGTDLNNLGAFTWVLWLYATTLTNLRMFASKDNGAAGMKYFAFNGALGEIQGQVTAATTNAFARTSGTPVAVNSWRCLAMTYDGSAVKLFHGRINQAMAECSYAFSSSRSGAAADDSAQTFMWGSDNSTLALQGRISMGAVFGSALSVTDLESWRKRPRKTVGSATALRFVRFGKGAANGIEYVIPDNCSVTGATQGDGVPLWQGPDIIVEPGRMAA